MRTRGATASHDDVKGAENPTHDHEYIGNGDTKKPDTAV